MKNSSCWGSTAKGFSLIELLIVLAVIAALTVSAFVIYPKVRSGQVARQEVEVILAAVSSIREMFPRGDYTNLSNQVAVDANLFPASMVGVGDSITNRWDGAVLLSPADRSPRLFRLTYRNVPSDVCVKMVPLLAQHFRGVSIYGEDGSNYIARDEFRHFASSSGAPRPLDESNIAQGCASSTGYVTRGLIVYDF